MDLRRLTVLTSLIFIITECTVEGGEFSELVAFELVLTFGNRSSLFATLVSNDRKNWKEQKLTVSMTLWTNCLALLTFSSVSAMIKQ
jgi:hypothetical protein